MTIPMNTADLPMMVDLPINSFDYVKLPYGIRVLDESFTDFLPPEKHALKKSRSRRVVANQQPIASKANLAEAMAVEKSKN